MGLDYHGLSFLKHVATFGGLGRTATLGRQEIMTNPVDFDRIMGAGLHDVRTAYCEPLLERAFGATAIESIDNSTFENATHLHDMNRPLPDTLRGQFDSVLDFGTLEHIYDIVTALRNCSDLCRPGGQIVHVLPTNNFCGHGFWQFSPELFFSLYSERNGYRDTQVFVADFTDKRRWYKVLPPTGGRRVNILSLAELYVMVRTVRADECFSHGDVQQSDYVYEWENNVHAPEPMAARTGMKGRLMAAPIVYDTLFPLYHRWQRLRSSERLGPRNPGLRQVTIDSLIR